MRAPWDTWLILLLVLGLGAVTLATWIHGADVDARLERLEASISMDAPARR